MGNAWKHFCTITHHKNLVLVGCFKIGLYRQGLLHDLSKYSPTEFLVGCKYYQGTMSPNNAMMAIPNLICMLLLSGEIAKDIQEFQKEIHKYN